MPKEQRFMFVAIGAAFLLLFVFWSIGYFLNGFYGYKFQIDSAWQGFMTLSGAGMINMGRYFIDSWKNSEQGVNPYPQEKKEEKHDDYSHKCRTLP